MSGDIKQPVRLDKQAFFPGFEEPAGFFLACPSRTRGGRKKGSQARRLLVFNLRAVFSRHLYA